MFFVIAQMSVNTWATFVRRFATQEIKKIAQFGFAEVDSSPRVVSCSHTHWVIIILPNEVIS